MLFDRLKTIEKENLRINIYDCLIINQICSMFKFKGFNSNYKNNDIMQILLCGQCALLPDDDGVDIFTASYMGEINRWGYTEKMLINAFNGETFEKKLHDECVAISLNNIPTCEYNNINRFATYLGEVDKSQEVLIETARNTNIIKTRSSSLKNMINEILKRRKKGEPSIIVSDNIIDAFNGDDVVNVELSKPEQIANMVHLSNYSNELRKRLYNLYGFPLNYNGKMAQQSVEEIDNETAICWIYPMSWYNNIKEAFEEFNERFGTSLEVEFSDVMQLTYKKLIAFENASDEDGNGVIEEKEIHIGGDDNGSDINE